MNLTHMPIERVTITMPREVVKDIDRRTRNRSKFILDAVRRELERRRREDLRISLRNPHEESQAVADLGIDEWGTRIPEGATHELLDPEGGLDVRWRAGAGWSTANES